MYEYASITAAGNRGDISMQYSIPVFLEQIFEFCALTGLEWKYRQMPQSKREILWENFTVKFNHVERTKTLIQNMAADVLYYPHDRTFPLVDMYYKNQFGKLVGIQATMSKTHAKGVSTYKRFYGLPIRDFMMRLGQIQKSPHLCSII